MKITVGITIIAVLCAGLAGVSCSASGPSYYTGVVEGETYSVSSPAGDRLVSLTAEEGAYVKKEP